MFSGTLRENLDLSGRITDDELIGAIFRCSLTQILKIEVGEDPFEFIIADGR